MPRQSSERITGLRLRLLFFGGSGEVLGCMPESASALAIEALLDFCTTWIRTLLIVNYKNAYHHAVYFAKFPLFPSFAVESEG